MNHHQEAAPDAGAEAFRQPSGALYPGWLTALASMAGLAFGPSALTVFCFGTFVTPLSEEFGWSIAEISVGATIVSVMIMLTAIWQGRLVDRFGGRPLILMSIPLLGAGVAALYFLPNNIWVFYAAWVAIPLLALGAWPISYLKLTASWFEQRLGLAFGVANAGIGFGAALLPPLAVYIIAHHGWRQAYLMLGLLAVVVTLPAAWFGLKERHGEAAARRHGAPLLADGLDFSAARRTRSFYLILLAFLLLGTASATVIVHQTRILIDLGMSPRQAGGLQAVLGIALIVGRICTGWLLDRVSAARIMAVLCLGAAAALAVLGAGAPSNSAVLCAAVLGFVIGAEFDVLSYIIPRYFGRRAFGALYGVIFAAFQFSSALAIAAVGVSRSQSGSYAGALWVVALLMLACSLCFKSIGPYRFGSRAQDAAAQPVPAALNQ